MLQQFSWFIEVYQVFGFFIGYCVEKLLYVEKILFQIIEIYQIIDWGNLMVIDGCVMLISCDNFFYYEMMIYLVLFIYVCVKCVVIIGGGDCGMLCEVFKYEEVEFVVQVEIDECVICLVEEYFFELCDVNYDLCVQLLFIDGIKYMVEVEFELLDLIIVDLIDLVGLVEGLFNVVFYVSCYKVLCYGGILVQQLELLIVYLELIKLMCVVMCMVGFVVVKMLLFLQLCYFIGWWSCMMVCKGGDLVGFCECGVISKGFLICYYNVDMYKVVLVQLEFMCEVLGE